MRKINIINSEAISGDISSLVNHIKSLSAKDKEWFSKVYFREVIKSKHYIVQSQDESTTHVKYIGSQELLDKARYIVDWLAGLQERDPKQHKKLARITFQQALKHSEKWHDELAKKAEQSDRYIEPDDENAPKVLDLGNGWEVFWLKSDEARDIEGEVMGHCVGSGAYDELDDGEAVFSIRKNNVAHITLHLGNLDIKQATTKGNGDVPERYQYLVGKASSILAAKLFVEYSLENQSIPDGWYRNSVGDKVRIESGLVNSDGDDPAVIWSDGTLVWYKDNKLHREDGPAVVYANCNEKLWYKNGLRHRDDGPAIIIGDGTQEWFKDGKRHRLDGPAVIYANGTQEWFINGLRHREDGPASIYTDGTHIWYKNGLRHREDGPAVIYSDGTQEWWLNGCLNRLYGPAIIRADGSQFWFQEDKPHRLDGPAVIREDGTQKWYKNGLLHRLDGPAIIARNGTQYWFINGIDYTEKEFNNIVSSVMSEKDINFK